MKIGFFTDSYLPSFDGVATSAESSARELRNSGHEVYIIAPGQPNVKERKNIFRIVSVRIVEKPDIWFGLEIPQPSLFKVATLDFDIIHGHSGGPISFLGWQLALLHNIPFIETYHTIWKHYKHYLPYHRLIKIRMIKKLTAFIGNDCDAVIAPTLKAKKDLLSDGVKKPVYILQNGIYTENFKNIEKGFLQKNYKVPKNKKIILTVGRLEKEKSIDFLIKSFAVAHQTNAGTALVVVGEGHDKESLIGISKYYGVEDCVYFIGLVPYKDLPKVYADSDIFVFSSHTETQGMVVAEALASGLPVVAVEDEAFEGVIENGKNGYLVKKDKEIFAGKIKYLLENVDLRIKMGHNCRKSAEQFSIYNTTKILEQIYEEVIFEKNNRKGNAAGNLLAQISIRALSFSLINKHLSKEYKNFKELLEKNRG